jgi:hypothetical protein
MRAADLFVLPSRIAADGDRDGLPNVLMEAASQLLPILSTPISAIPEFITDGVHGLLGRDTARDFADAMLRVARDPALGPHLAQAAHMRLHAEFTMAPGIAHLAARLRSILKPA